MQADSLNRKTMKLNIYTLSSRPRRGLVVFFFFASLFCLFLSTQYSNQIHAQIRFVRDTPSSQGGQVLARFWAWQAAITENAVSEVVNESLAGAPLVEPPVVTVTGEIVKRRRYNVHKLPKTKGKGSFVDVMICSDERTLGGMVAVMSSVLSNTNSFVYFHLVVPPSAASQLTTWVLHYFPNATFEVIPFDESLVKDLILVKGERKELGSPLNFARFVLPQLLPHFNRRLVYIDDDCLVRGDIKELRNLPLEAGMVGAFATDDRNMLRAFLNFDHPKIQALNYDPRAYAFNAGVFVVDMVEWKKQNITGQLLAWLEDNLDEDLFGSGAGGGASQPPMLIVLHKKVSQIPAEWHVRHFGWAPGESYTMDYVTQAKLMHWNGPKKPWRAPSRWMLVWHRYFKEDPSGMFKVNPEVLERIRAHREAQRLAATGAVAESEKER
eukprot:comp19732_c0_seq1/m.23523 comp19732_c0_seq1/g.23523  ORF comp19732_c0_seq1/g.23523 comp19732_c0_seq1/m.23523 type:complete len:439 (-) comp19732_c0_seq1:520-1836(-)